MSRPERSVSIDRSVALVSRVGEVLFANGQTTHATERMMKQLGTALGIQVAWLPAWGASTLIVDDDSGRSYVPLNAEPLAVDMNKVANIENVIQGLPGTILPDIARLASDVEAIAALPAAPEARFIAMCGAGALALAVIFGATDPRTLLVTALVGAAGGLLRRSIVRFGSAVLLQPLAAAFLAGLCSAIASRAGLAPRDAQWVALCGCMILVPGPQLLNGCLDLARARAALGCARIAYASVIVVTICLGLLGGLAVGGGRLSLTVASSHAPFAIDLIAAGVAVAAYGTFFSMPWRSLAVPVVIGMFAHSVRWLIAGNGGSVELATFAACIVVGALVTPLADRLKMPFAAFAFTASVSMIPGVYVFHTAAGFWAALSGSSSSAPHTLIEALLNLTSATAIAIAMATGLVASKMAADAIATAALRGARQRKHLPLQC